MKKLIFASAIFWGMSVWAAPDMFSGTWQGKGTYILRGDMTQCSLFKLVFNTTAETIEFTSGERVCEKHSENFYKVQMTYKDGGIYFQGQQVGTYDGNKIEVHYSMPDGNSHRNWRMSMRREGDNLVYEESRTMDGETTPMISFAGLLMVQN